MEVYLSNIKKGLQKLMQILLERFSNDNSTIHTNHSEIRGIIYDFTLAKPRPGTREKVEINKYVRENIQGFIQCYIAPKLTHVEKISKDPHHFVTTLNDIWSHYQVFVFSHYHVCDKLTDFFTNFYKMNNGKDYQYRTVYSKISEEVVAIPVMGVNELKRFFEDIHLIQKFKGVFNQFLQYEREGKNVPRAEIRESIHSLESCYFDMDAFTTLNPDGKPIIIKKNEKMEKLSLNRKSKDAEFFNNHLLNDTISSLRKFYQDFVNNRAMSMSSTDQIRKMISIINEQESRALYYIHTEQNRAQYVKVLNKSLIELNLQQRLRKEDGFRRYIELYEDKKEEYAKEIKDLWFIYSRTLEKAIDILKELFSDYLQYEAEKVADKTKKPPDFIEDLIRINSKCVNIVEFCNNNFELQNQRNNKIRGMLSNDLTAKGRTEGKFDIGAKNLASYINNKFKVSYAKGGLESLGETYKQLVALFKILGQKTRFLSQESRYMAARLLDEVEFSKDLEVGQIITMEKNFIEQIQKEVGVKEVKDLVENIKDIEKSIDTNNKIKGKIKENVLYPLNQIIIKNGSSWPDRSTYNIENPPFLLLKSYNALMDYFKKQNTSILMQFNSGVSIFQGDYETNKKQRFQFKNIYMLILLYVEESKKLLFGELKKKIESVGVNKQKSIIELTRAVIELLYSGLLVSETKSLKPGTPNICKLREYDELEINRKYDFIEEEKKKKGGKGPLPKPMAIIKGNILTLSQQLKKGFEEQIKEFNDDEKKQEELRKIKVQAMMVKSLKHAHHHNMNCNFQQLYKVTQQGRNKQCRVNEKFLKEIIEGLINKKYCERVENQRNVFRYIA